MTWYRQHRPTTINGLHLTQVRQTMQRFMAQGAIPQVMLFAGPKGTGKTSTARIVAAMLNDPLNEKIVAHRFFNSADPTKLSYQEPDATSEQNQNIYRGQAYVVQELDAASNRGIDDVRALKDRVSVPPQAGTISVYILDEVHMMTTEAFNALLKLLEEPPAHVVFILATTETHKIPATILSRATLVQFAKATTEELVAALSKVLAAEKITAEPEALKLIAESADGSFRDGVKLLESVAFGQKKVTKAMVEAGSIGSFALQLQQVLTAVLAKDATQVSFLFRQLREENVNSEFFFSSLLKYLHFSLLQSLGVESGTAPVSQAVSHFFLQELQQLPRTEASSIPLLGLELKLLELVFRSQGKSAKSGGGGPSHSSKPTPAPKPEPSVTSSASASLLMTTPSFELSSPLETLGLALTVNSSATILTTFDSPSVLQNFTSDNIVPLSAGDSTKLIEQWDAFVELMRDKNSSVAALLKSARPLSANNGKAQIAVFYKFHQEQLQQPKFMTMMQDCLKSLVGGVVIFEFVVRQPAALENMEAGANFNLASLAEELLV